MAQSQKVVVNTGGIGLGGVLLVLFIALKLTGHIAWSWVWVLSPAWIPLCLFAAIAVVILLVAAVAGTVDEIVRWRRRVRKKRGHG